MRGEANHVGQQNRPKEREGYPHRAREHGIPSRREPVGENGRQKNRGIALSVSSERLCHAADAVEYAVKLGTSRRAPGKPSRTRMRGGQKNGEGKFIDEKGPNP